MHAQRNSTSIPWIKYRMQVYKYIKKVRVQFICWKLFKFGFICFCFRSSNCRQSIGNTENTSIRAWLPHNVTGSLHQSLNYCKFNQYNVFSLKLALIISKDFFAKGLLVLFLLLNYERMRKFMQICKFKKKTFARTETKAIVTDISSFIEYLEKKKTKN